MFYRGACDRVRSLTMLGRTALFCALGVNNFVLCEVGLL